ncbi:hypothetical protein E4U53_003188 [Claviceps sorghi]|nr:hypothetical protein E4U53_003188 [Claviceps sorghi]
MEETRDFLILFPRVKANFATTGDAETHAKTDIPGAPTAKDDSHEWLCKQKKVTYARRPPTHTKPTYAVLVDKQLNRSLGQMLYNARMKVTGPRSRSSKSAQHVHCTFVTSSLSIGMPSLMSYNELDCLRQNRSDRTLPDNPA